eukprot:1736830-Rhodomonas_salina.2
MVRAGLSGDFDYESFTSHTVPSDPTPMPSPVLASRITYDIPRTDLVYHLRNAQYCAMRRLLLSDALY